MGVVLVVYMGAMYDLIFGRWHCGAHNLQVPVRALGGFAYCTAASVLQPGSWLSTWKSPCGLPRKVMNSMRLGRL